MVWSIELPFSSRKNLMFVRAETETFYISHGWLKMCGQRNFQRSNIFQPSNIFQDSTSSNALHMTLLHPPHPPTPPSVNNNETFNVATSSNQATSSRTQHHPTHFTWRYYTPPTPPTPPSVNNNETFNVATSSNQATSSRTQHHPTHFTWRYYTPPTPPTPPSVNNNETFNVATSSNQATSSRIQHHPTHFTWRYYTPPTPPSVNNNETFNVETSSNQATSSRIQHHPTHFTWRYHTPPHPPTPPICIQERPFWYSIKTEGSSKLRGTPSLEPIYIYICVCMYVCINVVMAESSWFAQLKFGHFRSPNHHKRPQAVCYTFVCKIHPYHSHMQNWICYLQVLNTHFYQ